MFLSLFYNKYGATILVVLAVMTYCYIFKPASLFDEHGNLKSKLLTPEAIALVLGVAAYFFVEFLTRSSPQEVVVVGNSSDSALPQGVPMSRRADALMSTPFTRRR